MVLSLDGYVCGPKGELDWENQDPQIGRDMMPQIRETVDSMILGRVLYEGFSQAWPAMAKDPNSPEDLKEFAHWIENSPKYVVSKTLEKAEWNNSTVISVQNDEDIIREVKKLKEQSGGDIVLFGGARLAQTMVRLDLVDEYHFKLQPIILGGGESLFKDVSVRRKLKLIQSKSYDTGVIGLYYESVKE